jgi:uncharacterized membrane protein YhaH (DUF805 family)
MGFYQAVRSAYSQYFRFSGRASRPEWWFWFLFLTVAMIFLAIAPMLLFIVRAPPPLSDVLMYTFLAFWAVSAAPHYALIFRRLHDVDRSGWWLLILLLPIVGLVLILYWLSQPGSAGTNKYGPPRNLTLVSASTHTPP